MKNKVIVVVVVVVVVVVEFFIQVVDIGDNIKVIGSWDGGVGV